MLKRLLFSLLLAYGFTAKAQNTTPVYVVIPNAFTPNGDGINDVFKPMMSGISSFEMYIYTRRGELAYKSTDQNEGWNGRALIPPFGMYDRCLYLFCKGNGYKWDRAYIHRYSFLI